MDSSKINMQPVVLHSQDIDSLKAEVGVHLAKALCRQPKDKTLYSSKIPFGFGGVVEVGQMLTSIVPFPIAGTVTDFMSFAPSGTKEVYMKISIVTGALTQLVEQRLQDGFRTYDLKVDVPAVSFAKLELYNKGKEAIEVIIGFTFQERLKDEIKALGLIGSL